MVRLGGVNLWHPGARGYAEQLGRLGEGGRLGRHLGAMSLAYSLRYFPALLLSILAGVAFLTVLGCLCVTLLHYVNTGN